MRYLLLIAHPDDEIFFFSPFILSHPHNIHILCLSRGSWTPDGNSRSLGITRTKELQKICALLHCGLSFPTHQFKDNPLKDNPERAWCPARIIEEIAHAVREYRCTGIVSFDAKGVSRHPNHICCYIAAKQYMSTHNTQREGIPHISHLLCLHTPPLALKYLGVIASLIYLARHIISLNTASTHILLRSSCPHRRLARSAITDIYVSQRNWYRWLNQYCAMLIYVNVFTIVL
eukprot:gnl/Dysnectes_brevis/6174_a9357_678.p1 GENE.gnl/Dysnectes_brevis/6174_a9357_678~~gnl/Dysnectes_brevis/6174_a9357_678.p1  ORF type:complete len:251 (-),score=14.96 gnl/Dysnectes_brevis/6174_a9357_678:34-729(-)